MDRVTSMVAFVKVADTGGFSAAGRALNMSPSMVSNHIQSLEDRLGVRLLNRSTRSTSLTEVGKTYYERTVQVLADMEEAERAAQALQSTPRGSLRLNASIVMPPLLAEVIAEFVELYPEASVEMRMTDRLADLVEERFDLAVSHMPVEESSFISRRIASYRFIVCGSPNYFAKRGVPRVPSDLSNHNCLIYSQSMWGNEWRFVSAGQEQAIRVLGNLRANSVNALKSATLLGQGLALAPTFLIEEELRSGQLIGVLGEYLQTEYAVSAIYPHRHRVTATVRSFIDLLTKHFRSTSGRAQHVPSAALCGTPVNVDVTDARSRRHFPREVAA
jgi:DNA-binding transcriptional LysR family regulator